MQLRWPWATVALTAAVVAVQADLWLNPSNMQQVVSLRGQLAQQQATNRAAEERNQRAAAELTDLKEGLEMVEEKARRELGMVKADEILVQYAPRGAGAPSQAGSVSTSSSNGAVGGTAAAAPSSSRP